MSEEQLSAFLAALKVDAGLQGKFKAATDLDAAVAIAKEAGFDVNKVDLLRYHQAKQTLELTDAELERVAGGEDPKITALSCAGCNTRELSCYTVYCTGC